MRNSANALLLGMLFFFLLLAGGVEAADSTDPNDYFFYDDAETGAITDKYDITRQGATRLSYSTTVAYEGSKSFKQVLTGSALAWAEDYTLSSVLNTSQLSSPFCHDFWYYRSVEANANAEAVGCFFVGQTEGDANTICVNAGTTAGGYGMVSPLWTVRQPMDTGVWRYVKSCFLAGYNATGQTTMVVYNETKNIFNTTVNRNLLTRLTIVMNDQVGLSADAYIDNIRIWNYSEYGLDGPQASASLPYAHIKLLDSYDNSTISGVTVYLGTESNVTDGSGIAYFYNHTTGLNYTTDGGPLYFSASGTAVENATTNAYTYGAFVSLSAYNIANASVATFNASSGSKVNTTTTGSLNLMLKPNTSNTIVVNGSGYLSKTSSITPTGEDLGSYNITGLYQSVVSINGTHYNGSKIYNFTINYTGVTNGTVTTTSGTEAAFTALFGNYTVIFDASGYALYNTTIVVNATTKAYQFVAYTTNSILFSFYDVDTDDLINGTNITVQIDGGLGEYTTSTGSLYIDLITPATYNMAYAALGFVDGFYIFTITDRSTQAINLTMLNLSNSDQVTLYVYDKLGNRLEGAVIKILRYDITNNTFETVSILQTNIEGLVETSLTKDTQYYKFIIEYDDEVRYTSVPTYIYGTTLSFYINTAGETLVSTFDGSQINGQISFNEATGQASFTYSDADNIATQGCLYAYKASDLSLLNSTCVSSSTGVLYLPTSNTTTNWYLAGKVTKGGIEYLIDTYRKDYDATLPDTGGLGMFLGFIIFVVIIFIGIWSLEVAVVLGSALPLLLTFTGLIAIGYVISVPVFILGLIAAFIIGVKR